MCANKHAAALICGVICLASTACATNYAPSGWLPQPREARRQAYGGWAYVEYCSPRSAGCKKFAGELIAVEPDTVLVMSGTTVVPFPVSGIRKFEVMGYDPNTGDIVLGGLAGTLFSASHGWIAIVSASVWIITTAFAAAAQSHLPHHSHPSSSLEEFRKYARFPQGLPEGVALDSLTPKPRENSR